MSNRALQHTLYYGKSPVAAVIPDENYLGMWRVQIDGWVSDMVNLTRAKDAAIVLAERAGRDPDLLRWRKEPLGQPHRSPVVSLNPESDPPATCAGVSAVKDL
jgi:hypothetical protein